MSLREQFHGVSPEWSLAVVWSAALITSLLFFVALLLHELAHSILARARGLRVRAITLFALGGVSQIESEASDAKSEFWIAFVGPLTSFVLGLICFGIASLAGWSPGSKAGTPVSAVFYWLGYINTALAAFNMIPGYPLDGGRVLRAVTWWITGNADRSTRIAAQVGQVVALLFIISGLIQFFSGKGFGALWIAFIGWFLLDASRSSYIQVELMSGLRDRRVADIMERDCGTVESHLSLQDFVDEYMLRSGRRCFVVIQNNYLVGLITPNEVKQEPRDQWAQTSVQSVMRPLRDLKVVTPDTPALQALELMTREDINQLPVVSNGHLEGVFSRGQVLRFLQTHSELHGH
ncbi:MAG TPA: site-2 protease family protein [Terriglobales bacterium]|nr:site-2 protease family protein [Terriglobales bacterium]